MRSLSGTPAVRVPSSHLLNMCEHSHKQCMTTKHTLQCKTCKVSCKAAFLPEKAQECADIFGKIHSSRRALISSEWDQIKSELRLAVKTDEQSGDLPTVVGRWDPHDCLRTTTPRARCCEHEYYWCHRSLVQGRKCRHCTAAVTACRMVPEKVPVFNSNLTGPERAAIALGTLGTGGC